MTRAMKTTGAKLAATTIGPAIAIRATEVAVPVLVPASDSAIAAMEGIDPAAGLRQWPSVTATVVMAPEAATNSGMVPDRAKGTSPAIMVRRLAGTRSPRTALATRALPRARMAQDIRLFRPTGLQRMKWHS